jgi:hypothetical protein
LWLSSYRLLAQFRRLFEGTQYLHRSSNLGDRVAMQLYEDLAGLRRGSARLKRRIASGTRVLNSQNKRKGIEARRGDGTFGEIIPDDLPLRDAGYHVARGKVATLEIGVEVKILAKAMIKQIDRVIGDFNKQVGEFRRRSGARSPICIAVVGINYAEETTSYEGDRSYRTDGRRYQHPAQEAPEARRRILAGVRRRNGRDDGYDEVLILPYKATNVPPYPFAWLNEKETQEEYGAVLTRVSREYEQRF